MNYYYFVKYVISNGYSASAALDVLAPLRLSVLLSSPLSLLLLANSDDLKHLFLVEFFESARGDHFLVVFFSEEEARLLESFTIEVVSVLEDLAN